MRGLKIASAALLTLSVSFTSTAASAAACQPGGAGCVLPLGAPPAPVVDVSPTTTVAEPLIEESGGGIGSLLPALLGLAALAAIVYFLLDEDDDGTVTP